MSLKTILLTGVCLKTVCKMTKAIMTRILLTWINRGKAYSFYLLANHLLPRKKHRLPCYGHYFPPQEIDPEQDMGYGPATYTTIEQTKEVNEALNNISVDELKNKFNGNLMLEMGIYPEVWDNDESQEFLIEDFNRLKEFYNKAVASNQAVIFFIN